MAEYKRRDKGLALCIDGGETVLWDGAVGNVRTIMFGIKKSADTKLFLDLATDKLEISVGDISGTGLTQCYVNNVDTNTVLSNVWQFVIAEFSAGINFLTNVTIAPTSYIELTTNITFFNNILSAQERAKAYERFLHAAPLFQELFPRFLPEFKASEDRDANTLLHYNMLSSVGKLMVDITNNEVPGTLNGNIVTTLEGIALNGIDNYVAVNLTLAPAATVKTIAMRIKLATTTEQIYEGQSNAILILANAGVLTAADWDNIYIDGIESTTVQAGVWHNIVVTSSTVVDNHTPSLGWNSALFTYGKFEIEDFQILDVEWTEAQVQAHNNSFVRTVLYENLLYAPVGNNLPVGWQKKSGTFSVKEDATSKYISCDGAGGIELKGIDLTNAYLQRITGEKFTFSRGSNGLTVDMISGGKLREVIYLNHCKLTNEQWYGIEIDESNSSPDVTRIASNMSLHATLPVHSRLKGCVLNDDGTVNYYLDPADWSKKADGTASVLDGVDGQVMVEWPDFYYKVESNYPSAGKHQIKISLHNLSGFTKVEKHYVSAYETAIKRSTSTLASVQNMSTGYRGGNNTAGWDAGDNSLLGMPVTNFNRTNGRTYARNRGAGWNLYGYNDHTWLFWFFAIEYATLNSQKAVNAALTAEGYKQGGLGNGVSTAISVEWNTFNSYNPFILCGASDSLASGTGEVSVVKTNFGGAGVDRTFTVPRYRGHENPFGHIWKQCDGVNVEVQAVAAGDKTNTYVADNPDDWNDVNYTNYVNYGEQARANGYQKKALLGATANFVPADTTGSSATYYCDYYYTSIPGSGVNLRMLLVGGEASAGAGAGFVYSCAAYAPSYAHAYFGSRLCFKAA